MMVTIHGLPVTIKYQDLKAIIKQECKIADFILDNLVSESDGLKKVRVGLADDSEGAHVIKCLNGYRLSGYILSVTPVGKSGVVNQSAQINQRGFQNDSYPSQMQNEYGRPDQARVDPWSNNQWNTGQQIGQPQGTFNYQQAQNINTYATPVVNQQIRPQFEQRSILSRIGPPSQGFAFAPKNDIPVQTTPLSRQGVLRTVELVDTPHSSNRNIGGNFDMSRGRPDLVRDRPNMGRDRSDLARDRPDLGRDRPDLGRDRPDLRDRPELGRDRPDQARNRPDLGRERPDLGRDRPDLGRNRLDLGRDRPELGRDRSEHGRDRPVMERDRPLQVMGRDRIDLGRDRTDLGRDRPGMGRDRPDMGRDRADVARDRPDLVRSRSDLTRDRPDVARDRNIIMKDHFKDQFGGTQKPPGNNYPNRNPWATQDHQKPEPFVKRPFEKGPHADDRKFDRREITKEPLIKHSGAYKDQFSQQDRIPSHLNRNADPSGRNSPPIRRISPPGKRVSPHGRRISPSDRISNQTARGRSPLGRRISPPGRRISPSGRRISPTGRRISPTARRISPPARQSPLLRTDQIGKRNMGVHSPVRRDEDRRLVPGQDRYSPAHLQEVRAAPKQVRPAYEPPASNQAMYSGGYRPNIEENVQYPQGRSDRPDRWSDREKTFNKPEEERRDSRMSKFDTPRVDNTRSLEADVKRPRSQNRDSRSPRRDRYRGHSPSPRSPHRSWALEKRRSPDDNEVPPPPIWPGQDSSRVPDVREKRQPYPERVEETRPPTWDMTKYVPKADDIRREPRGVVEEKRHFDREPAAMRKDIPKWKPIGNEGLRNAPARYEEDIKERSTKRKEFEGRQHDFKQHEDSRRSRLDRRELDDRRQEYEDRRYKSDYRDASDFNRMKEELSRRIEKKTEILKKQEELQKEIEDVYKRAVDFTKKAEMYKKSDRRRDDREDSSHRRRDELESTSYERYSDRFEDRRGRDDTSKKPYTDRNREDVRPDNRGVEEKAKLKGPMSPSIRAKREKASEEISEKLLAKYGNHLPQDIQKRVLEELKLAVINIFNAMFGEEDVSFIEMVVKFNSRHTSKDEGKIYDDVMMSFPSHYRKRSAAIDDSGVPAKTSKISPGATASRDEIGAATYQIPSWDYSYVAVNPELQQMAAQTFMSQQYVMAVQPLMPAYTDLANGPSKVPVERQDEPESDEHNLYLCKDDFQPMNDQEAHTLKDYLIQQMVGFTMDSTGWAPDFTLKGLQSPFRYEVVTRDEASKNWLLDLDFSTFQFNVLVYSKEELWYERAAVWLPGHSKCRNIEPLTKLKLQNKFLEGVNIGKWKLVKKIVTTKGTRVYVDMPPSSARALENHQMTLSYELQKVNVFLKAVAVDKDAFDAGLKEVSIKYMAAPLNAPMPSLQQDPNAIKFCLKGDKPVTLAVARKIKDCLIYQLFKYHQTGGRSRTDFTKYGFVTPGYFGVLPENNESKQWLLSINLGTINRQPVVVMGADDHNIRYIKMSVVLPSDLNANLAFERLRSSNQGVKGINFHKWRNAKVIYDRKPHRAILNVDMDMASVESIAKINYQLDYVGDGSDFQTLAVRSEYTPSRLDEIIRKYKEELSDSYVVANMDLDSDDDCNDDVVCLD